MSKKRKAIKEPSDSDPLILKTTKSTIIVLVAIVLLSLIPRLYKVQAPIMVFHSWRQCDTAAIARNIYRSGFDIFHPTVDYNGNNPSTVECEFQVYGFITALFYAVFGIKEAIGRLVSMGFYLLTTVPMAWLGKKLWGKTGDVWTLLFFGLSPIGIIMSRSFQPDSTMLFFMVSSVAAFWHYLDLSSKTENLNPPNQNRWLYLSGTLLALALLTKLVAAYIGIVFLGLTLSYRGLKGLKQKDIWLTAAMGLIPSFLWYYYAHSFPMSFNIWGLGPQKLSNWTGWATQRYYSAFKSHFIGLSLTESVFWIAIGGIIAILFFEKKINRTLPLSWILGGVIYQILTAKHFAAHSYYYYPVVPAFILCGAWLPSRISQRFKLPGTIVVFIILTVLTAPRSFDLLYPQMYSMSEHPQRIMKLAKLIKENSEKDDLIVTAVGHGHPEALYYADRRGWHIDYRRATVEKLRHYVKDGATHFGWLQPILRGFRPSQESKITLWPLVDYLLKNEIESNYCLGVAGGYYIAIDLKKNLSASMKDGDNVCQMVSAAVGTCVRTGNNLEALTNKTGINCFILPWPDLEAEKYGIINSLFANEKWKLIYFTDHGMIFLKAEGKQKEVAFSKAYSYVDPLNRNGNFCQLKKMDSTSLKHSLTEARRAYMDTPEGWRAAALYGALLGTNGEYKKAITILDTPLFKERYPLASRINHLVCSFKLNDEPEIRRLVNEILARWPNNEMALEIKKVCKI